MRLVVAMKFCLGCCISSYVLVHLILSSINFLFHDSAYPARNMIFVMGGGGAEQNATMLNNIIDNIERCGQQNIVKPVFINITSCSFLAVYLTYFKCW